MDQGGGGGGSREVWAGIWVQDGVTDRAGYGEHGEHGKEKKGWAELGGPKDSAW